MQKNKLHILSTRPLEENILKKAADQNIVIDCISFIDTEPVDNKDLEEQIRSLLLQKITVVFTSMNAVEAVKKHIGEPTNWDIFCMGNTTRQLVTDTFGETSIKATANNAAALADAIIDNKKSFVYFFCGDQRRDELPLRLRKKNIQLEELVVYRTIELKQKISKAYNGILFYSPSAVHSFFSENKIDERLLLFAIGNTTAEAIKEFVTNTIIIADQPGKENLVYKMISHFSTIQSQIK